MMTLSINVAFWNFAQAQKSFFSSGESRISRAGRRLVDRQGVPDCRVGGSDVQYWDVPDHETAELIEFFLLDF
jgi:hypothetical protein